MKSWECDLVGRGLNVIVERTSSRFVLDKGRAMICIKISTRGGFVHEQVDRKSWLEVDESQFDVIRRQVYSG